ncbi:DUF3224 domain-containing protein [Ktedonospora formicarum]|uniref:DUF3224 domain-containing protein n=1 Tax=Ktedonospora formicarum TaxID=2778364 RepID=A0A8J3MU08_9CHLR|nr:DUF3224 domain-containing protein [Ktedonospora formicarum]GHO46466.1 hypothetical protein KSX_46290 [Ktedonospora formicarum]
MNIQTKSHFKIVSWEQSFYDEPEAGAKLARADVKKVFEGEIEAEGSAVLLLCQGENDGNGYVATEKITGRIGERSGSFVIQHGGAIAGTTITDSFGYVVPGSGTDELQGIRGHCSWQHDEQAATFTLDYEIEQ